jgi:hypothetical protein
MHSPLGRTFVLASVAICAVAVATTYGRDWTRAHNELTGPSTKELHWYASFCTPVAPEARIDGDATTDYVFAANVSIGSPNPLAISQGVVALHRVRAGSIVEFRVHSAEAVAVGVHGLSEIVPIESHGEARIRFRAIYTGRFPLHVHGMDGSHYEIAAIEVMA